jgi:hypothetical protein
MRRRGMMHTAAATYPTPASRTPGAMHLVPVRLRLTLTHIHLPSRLGATLAPHPIIPISYPPSSRVLVGTRAPVLLHTSSAAHLMLLPSATCLSSCFGAALALHPPLASSSALVHLRLHARLVLVRRLSLGIRRYSRAPKSVGILYRPRRSFGVANRQMYGSPFRRCTHHAPARPSPYTHARPRPRSRAG